MKSLESKNKTTMNADFFFLISHRMNSLRTVTEQSIAEIKKNNFFSLQASRCPAEEFYKQCLYFFLFAAAVPVKLENTHLDRQSVQCS